MAPNGSISGYLQNVGYPFIAITLSSTLMGKYIF